MAASEKLKQIMDERGWPPYDREVGERLLAVVEAAALAIEDILLMDGPEGDSPRNIAGNLRAALTALDQALSDG